MNGVVQLFFCGLFGPLPLISNPRLQRDASPAGRLRAPELAHCGERRLEAQVLNKRIKIPVAV